MISLAKAFFIAAAILFVLSIFVPGPLVAIGLACLAAGHAV